MTSTRAACRNRTDDLFITSESDPAGVRSLILLTMLRFGASAVTADGIDLEPSGIVGAGHIAGIGVLGWR